MAEYYGEFSSYSLWERFSQYPLVQLIICFYFPTIVNKIIRPNLIKLVIKANRRGIPICSEYISILCNMLFIVSSRQASIYAGVLTKYHATEQSFGSTETVGVFGLITLSYKFIYYFHYMCYLLSMFGVISSFIFYSILR